MLKTMKKLLALFLVISLLSLGHLAAMPGVGTADTAVAGPVEDEGQGLIEIEDDYGPARARKSSFTPILIGLLAAGAVAAVLFLVVLKEKYNIVGSWNLNFRWTNSGSTGATVITFSGNKKSGSFQSSVYTGTYTVNGKNVTWVYSGGTTYTGNFTDKNSMSGTMVDYNGNPGTWTATKQASTSSTAMPLSTNVTADENSSTKRN